MNLSDPEKIFKKARSLRLSKNKKHAVLQEVLLFIKKTPLQEKKNTWIDSVFLNIFRVTKLNVALASLAFVLLLSGVTVVSAEYAIPGDILYPIKIGVNEKVLSAFAFSDEKKAKVNTSFVERRLLELEKLVIENKLQTIDQKQLSSILNMQSYKTSENINSLDEKNLNHSTVEATSNFESVLRAHNNVLKKLENDENKNIVGPMLIDIQKNTKYMSDIRIRTQDQIIKDSSSDDENIEVEVKNKLESAEGLILEVSQLIKDKKNRIGNKAVSEASNNLDIAQEKIDKGKNAIESKSYQEAFSLLQNALQISKETKNLIKAKDDLNVEINIDIDEYYRNGQDK